MENLKAEVSKLDITMYGKNTVQMKYKPKSKVTKAQITAFVQKKSDALKKKGFKGKIAVNILFDHGWRGGYFEEVGEPIELYELGDSDYGQVEQTDFSRFNIYMIPE